MDQQYGSVETKSDKKDKVAEPALEFVAVIGGVGGDVSGFLIGSHQNPVFFVAEFRRFQPESAVFLIGESTLFEGLNRPLDLAGFVERAFVKPCIILKSKGFERGSLRVQHPLQSRLSEERRSLFQRRIVVFRPCRRNDLLRDIFDIVAGIAVLREIRRGKFVRRARSRFAGFDPAVCKTDRMPQLLQISCIGGLSEKFELIGVESVVDVELSLNFATLRSEEIPQDVAKRGGASVHYADRAGRIGAHEFYEYFLAGSNVGSPVTPVFRFDFDEFVLQPRRLQEEVHETRSGDLNFRDEAIAGQKAFQDSIGDFAAVVQPGRLLQSERYIA